MGLGVRAGGGGGPCSFAVITLGSSCCGVLLDARNCIELFVDAARAFQNCGVEQ